MVQPPAGFQQSLGVGLLSSLSVWSLCGSAGRQRHSSLCCIRRSEVLGGKCFERHKTLLYPSHPLCLSETGCHKAVLDQCGAHAVIGLPDIVSLTGIDEEVRSLNELTSAAQYKSVTVFQVPAAKVTSAWARSIDWRTKSMKTPIWVSPPTTSRMHCSSAWRCTPTCT